MKKTNAARFLDKNKIPYEILAYEVDESDLSAIHVAHVTGMHIKQIFKTLVAVDEKNTPLVACIEGDGELSLKALAKLAKVKKCTLIKQKELLGLTGYIRGGCSPLAMKKRYKTFLDAHALEFEHIYISAGERGKQLKVTPQDLLRVLDAKSGDILQ